MSSCYHKRDAGMKFYDFAMTLEEIGQELGISRERVRQLEARALTKARVILRRRGYTLQDLLGGDHHG
jgi:DNA-directed RNA polymerase sigma subunit (sigma70/sigma32)